MGAHFGRSISRTLLYGFMPPSPRGGGVRAGLLGYLHTACPGLGVHVPTTSLPAVGMRRPGSDIYISVDTSLFRCLSHLSKLLIC